MLFPMANVKKTPEKTDSELVRRFKSNPALVIGTFVVLVIVIIAFVLVPAIVPSAAGANMDLTFGYYDKVPITYVPGNFFAQVYERVIHSRQNTGDNDNYAYSNPQIWREAFQEAAVHTAILREMQKSGYTAPEKVVDREVARLPQFQVNGKFSPVLYRQVGDNQRLSIWRQVQEDIIKEHFRSDVAGLLKPAAEASFIGAMVSTERSFDMAVFSVDAYPEAEYTTYIQENPELFRTIHLSMITISSGEREAQKVLASIKNGETTFEDAARAFSKDYYADRGGDMGPRMVYELGFDISEETEREKVIALARGEYSDIIKTGNGWSVFRIEEPLQSADSSDSAVMEKVRSYVRNYRRGRMEDWAIAQADNFIALVNEVGFEDALSQQQLAKRSFGPIPLNYAGLELFTTLNSQSIPELSGADSNENFWKTAFSTPVDSPSRPVVQGSNVLVLFTKDETTAEESAIENIVSYYSSWLMYMPNWIIQQYFMNSPKMENNFDEVYRRYFSEQ
jgi:hypothetical protein